MNRPLDSITIKGYKSIRELENLELRALNVLIGANGAGKSNFISAFKLLNRMIGNELQIFVGQSGGADTLLYFGIKTTSAFTIQASFGANGYRCILVPAAGGALIFADEVVWFHNKQRYAQPMEESLGSGHSETKLHDRVREQRTVGAADFVVQAMHSWKVYHFHDTSPSAKLKQTVDLNLNQVLLSDASNLAAFLYRLQKTRPDYYKQIVETVRLVAPFFDDFVLDPNPLKEDTILLRWHEKGAEGSFGADVLSDGTLRFICLATLLLQPKPPTTILIDEPELGLHPYAITLLASLLRSASTRTQVIVSTQSVTLVNQFGPEDVIVVDREDGQSTFTRHTQVDLENWLDDYGMGDLWEKNVLGGRPK